MSFILSFVIAILPSFIFAGEGFLWLHSLSDSLKIPDNVITLIFVLLILIVVGFFYQIQARKCQNPVIPDEGVTLRNLMEAYGQFILGECRAVIGEKEGEKYFHFFATLFIVILLSNLLGLIPGFLPPTEYLSSTLAIGVISFLYYNIKGCKEIGVINYIKHFAGPMWYLAILIFPIEIISNLIRPLSLALRLRGNISGDHIVLSTFSNLEVFGIKLALFVPLPFYVLGFLVALIQAYVFTMLSMVYVSLATAHHDHDEDSHH
jgi:F-type H+-transporting ATPase subunit a